PVAFFRNADGNRFVFIRVEPTNHGCGRSQRDFVFTASPAEQNTNPQSLLLWSHEVIFSKKRSAQKRLSSDCFQNEVGPRDRPTSLQVWVRSFCFLAEWAACRQRRW